MRVVMRVVLSVATVTLLTAAPLLAQTERGYVTGMGGFAVSPDITSGDVMGEAGVRIAPHLMLFGDLGQFHNLQPSDVQPVVDGTSALTTAQGLSVIGSARVPAWYYVGGLRFEVPTHSRISPYVLGGIGSARLTPKADFTFESGTLPDGSTPQVGDDVTSALVSAGDFSAPPATNAFMFTVGGGVDVPVARHWAVDVGYRSSRVSADTPLTAQGVTFGFGYRF
jgi:Outer membrane protein beta-barrel domain